MQAALSQAAYPSPSFPGLRQDLDYLSLLAGESRAPGEYFTSPLWNPPPPPAEACARDACAQLNVGPAQVDADTRLARGDHTRVRMRACQNRPQTELFGVAPYTVIGRGDLTHTDASTGLRNGEMTTSRGAKADLYEHSWSRPEFLSGRLPGAGPFRYRGGVITRFSTGFARP